jgi:hypothetical protein
MPPNVIHRRPPLRAAGPSGRQHYNYPCMDATDEIRLRMKISKLEAQLSLREIEIAALNREIDSPLTSLERRYEARKSLDAARGDGAKLITELDEIRRSYPNIHN